VFQVLNLKERTMTRTRTLLAAFCAGIVLAGGAAAQTSGGDKAAPSSDVDCMRGTMSASGTGSSQALRPHRSAKTANGSVHATIPSMYMQCTSTTDRKARAQCIRTAYENRYGLSGSMTVASNSTRKPCL
jgi:hypothetical protein